MSTFEKKKTNHLSNMLNSESNHSKSKSMLQDDLSKKKKLKSTKIKGGGAKEKPKKNLTLKMASTAIKNVVCHIFFPSINSLLFSY